MPVLLLPADVEQAIIDELNPQGVPTASSLLDPMPASQLRVVSAGGFQRDLTTDSHLVTLESFAKLEHFARSNLAMAVARLQIRQQVNHMIGNEVCYGVTVAGALQNLPLSSLPSHKRYIVTLSLDLRRQSTSI